MRAVNPGPVFPPFAQAASHRIHHDVTDFSLFFVVVTQAMIEEIALPFDRVMCRQIVLPVRNRFLHPGLARKGNNAVEMVRHEQ